MTPSRHPLAGPWLALPLLLAVLAQPGSARGGWIEDRDDKTVIHLKVFDLPDPSKTDPYSRSELAAVRAFRQRFPALFAERWQARCKAQPERYGKHNWDCVEVELEKFSGIQIEGVEVDLLAIAGGMAPDVLYVNFRRSEAYIRNGFLHPLDRAEDGYLAAMPADEVSTRIYPKIEPVVRRKGPGGQTHVWTLPYGGALGRVLLYRKDLFDSHGIPYPSNRWTWNDLLDASKRLTDPARGVYGLLLVRHLHDESYQWLPFLWSAGGEVMKYDEPSDSWRCVFDGPEAAIALDFYTQLIAGKWTDASGRTRRGYTSRDVGDFLQKWSRGEIAMMFSYIDEKVFSAINPEVTGMAPVPMGPTGLRAGELNGRMLGLFAGIEEPAVRDAAWEFMRFYDGEEAMRIKTRVLVESGMGPFINPRYLRQFGYPEIERLSPAGWAETFDIAIASGKPEPCGKNSNLAYTLMSGPIHRAEQLALRDELPAERAERLAVLEDLLRKACARANEQMMGVVPPGVRTLRRATAAVVLTAMIAAFVLLLRRAAKAFRPPGQNVGVASPTGRRMESFRRRYAFAYLLLAPAVIAVLVWCYVPLGRGTIMAFQNYALMGRSSWAGLDNFGDLLFDGVWWGTVWNSLRYSGLVIALTFLPPLGLAILLQEIPRGRLLLRTIYYLPAVISGLVTILMWKQFYEVSDKGVLNAVMLRIPAGAFLLCAAGLLWIALSLARRLRRHGMRPSAWVVAGLGVVLCYTAARPAFPILLASHPGGAAGIGAFWGRLLAGPAEPYRWLVDPDTAMLSCVLPMVWAGVGPGCLIYLAALKGIPDEYYEAADMDGASFGDKVLFIVLPNLRALLSINFVGAFIGAWYHAAGNVLAMTGGGGNTEVADLHIWYKAFTYLKFGPATAMAWMLGFMLVGFTVQQLRILARVEFRSTKG